MKKFSVLLLVISLFLAVAAFSVSAAVVPPAAFTSTNPTWGSNTQVASNPKADDVADREVLVAKQVDFTSVTGSVFFVSFTPATGFSATDINLTTSTVDSDSLSFTARISEKLDAVNANLEEVAFKVGTITVDDASASLVSFDVYMQRENNLELDKIDVEIVSPSGATNSESIDTDGGDEVKDVKPGDTLNFDIQVQNIFDSDSNVEINDVNVKVDVQDEINEDQDEDIGDLSEDDEDTATITIEVADDVDDGTNSGLVTVDGRDRFGAKHGDSSDFDIEVNRERHDIQVQSVVFNPTQLSCKTTSLQISMKLHNIGRSDEDDVAVEVFSQSLGISERRTGIQLDKDDTQTEVFDLQITPSEIESGIQAVQIQTFTDNADLSNTEVVQINNQCGIEVPAPTPTTGSADLTLTRINFEGNAGELVSIPVQVTNNDNVARDFAISVTNVDEFAEVVSEKPITLGARQTQTVLVPVQLKDKAKAGTYTATVNLRSGAATVDSASATVVVSGKTSTGASGIPSSVWIVADIVLIIIGAILVALIFRGRN